MRSGDRIAVGIASVIALAVSFTACGSSTNDSMVTDSSTAGSNAAGTGGTANINVGSGGSSNGTSTGTGAGNGVMGVGGDACAAQVSNGQLVPLDMYIMLDISSSMLDFTASKSSKWDSVKAALEAFLADKDSAGLGVGLQYFPLKKPGTPDSCTDDASCGDSGPCFSGYCEAYLEQVNEVVACSSNADCRTGGPNGGPCDPLTVCSNDPNTVCDNPGGSCGKDSSGADLGACAVAVKFECENAANCDAAAYATPAQAIATLPDAAAGLKASIEATTPDGNTPTGPALTGAIQQATTWAKAHPDHRVVAVMATDGLPTQCTPTDIADVGAIAAQGASANPSIDTFVIGVFSNQDADAPGNLDTIAKAGGTGSAFIVDTSQDVTTQFLAALDAIRGGKLDCAFQIPQPTGGQELDYHLVNVQVTSSGDTITLPYVTTAASCDATAGGWYYDVDPDVSTPSQIITCPASCTAFQAAKGASVQIALGCMTIIK